MSADKARPTMGEARTPAPTPASPQRVSEATPTVPPTFGPVESLNPAILLYLQRIAGNASVAALMGQTIQRDPDAAQAVADPARAEWAAHRRIHPHFNKGFEDYVALRPSYVKLGIENPAKWLDETVANNTVRFFGHETPGHPDLQPPLTAAQGKLRTAPAINSFWSFVPRPIRGSTNISNHALGRAVDINPSTNPRIIDRTTIQIVKAVTGVDLGKPQDEATMRQASEDFKAKFNDTYIKDQLDKLVALKQRQTELAAAHPVNQRAIREVKGQIKQLQGQVNAMRSLASKGFLDLPHDFVEALKSSGLHWGGDYRSSKDFMHFELGPMASAGGGAATSATAPTRTTTPTTTTTPAATTTSSTTTTAPGTTTLNQELVAVSGGTVRRITVEGLTQGYQRPKKAVPGAPTPGEAVALIPPLAASDSGPVEVLVHLHGFGIGYRRQTKQLRETVGNLALSVGEERDVALDKTEAQLVASGRRMVGVLPQGGTHSEVGSNFDAKSYAEEVFGKLVALGVWSKAPSISGVVLSGHSGAGGQFAGMLAKQMHKPDYLRELILFDAINGSNELDSISHWLVRVLKDDLAQLRSAGSEAARHQYLTSSFRFRGIHSHSAYYSRMYAQLEARLKDWFDHNDAELQRLGCKAQLWQNYLPIVDTGAGVSHEEVIGKHDRLAEALRALGPNAPIPPEAVKEGQSARQPDKDVGEKREGAAAEGGEGAQSSTQSAVTTSGGQADTLPVLHLKMRHAQVVVLKGKLVEHGALKTAAMTDEFDDSTYKAVRRFQWSYGLKPDGVVGRMTWLMLMGPPMVELDSPESVAAFDAAYAEYREVYAKGQANRKAHGDWGDQPPVGANPGEYGETWARLPSSVKVGGHLNWRYNNPGNILPGYKEHSFGGYAGALNVAALSGLAIFPTWEAGWNALRNLLLSQKFRDLTLDLVFQRYVGTPAGHKSAYGDDPDAYLRSVIGQTGLHASQRIKDLSDGDLKSLMHAIRNVEGRQEGKEYQQGDSLPPLLAQVFGGGSPQATQ